MESPEYDPEATVEFDVIERPLTEVEEELVRTLDPDQVVLEGIPLVLPTRKYKYDFPPEDHWGENLGMGI